MTNLHPAVSLTYRCTTDSKQQRHLTTAAADARVGAAAAGSDANVDVTATSRRFLLLQSSVQTRNAVRQLRLWQQSTPLGHSLILCLSAPL